MSSTQDDRGLPCQVAPFGNPRINACLAAPRGLSQLTTPFIASRRQGIHRAPYLTCPLNLLRILIANHKTLFFLPWYLVFRCQRTIQSNSQTFISNNGPLSLNPHPPLQTPYSLTSHSSLSHPPGGECRDRTGDLWLAKPALSQLS